MLTSRTKPDGTGQPARCAASGAASNAPNAHPTTRLGPAAAKLKAADVQVLMRDLPAAPACKSVLRELTEGRERTSKVLSFEKWGQFGLGQGSSQDGGRSSALGNQRRQLFPFLRLQKYNILRILAHIRSPS